MSLLKVNNIESLNGPTGTINMTGNLVVNGMPISGSTGATGAPGPTGPEGAGGISGSILVYVSADSDPATNGLALQAAYTAAKALATSTSNATTNSITFDGMSVYMSLGYDTLLQAALIQSFSYGGNSSPIAITINGTAAYYSYDGMSIKMSRTDDMMTPVEMGTWDVIINIRVYTESTLIIAPGYYQTNSTFNIDSDFVNITSLSGNPDVFIYNLLPAVSGYTVPAIYVTANYTTITGLSTDLSHPMASVMPGMYDTVNNAPAPIALGSNLYFLVMKNCRGGKYSFGEAPTMMPIGIVINGTFINCTVKNDYGFGWGNAAISGRFKDCTSEGYYGFGYNNCTLSGTFENCKSLGGYAFGAYGGILSGVFINCSEQGNSGFGVGNSTISGTFNNCRAGDYSFGQSNDAINNGVWINCVGGASCWTGTSNSGAYYNCVGGASSWTVLNLAAILNHCVIKAGSNTSFGTVDSMSGGRTRYCVDGFGMTNNQG